MKYISLFIAFISVFILVGDAHSFRQIYPPPKITTHYTKNKPASNAPLLTWNENTQAVYYELEVFDKIPKNLRINALSSEHIYYTSQIFVNAFNISLGDIDNNKSAVLY